MIYSVHNAVKGGFDYFEAGPDTPINDDLPTPQLRGASSVGVAASAAGRPLPPGARSVGRGLLPVGSICSGRPGVWRGAQKGGLTSGLGAFVGNVDIPPSLIAGTALLVVAVVATLLLTGTQEQS